MASAVRLSMDRLTNACKLIELICGDRDKSELEKEYNLLGLHSPYRETIWGNASHECMMKDKMCEIAAMNLDLNRFSNILPFDKHLATCSKGYINASVITPLGRKFIVAQGPMSEPDTREAFWYTVIENNVKLMVNLAPFGAECSDYIGQGNFGDVDVSIERQVTTNNASNNVIYRKLKITTPSYPPYEVEHVQFDHWPNYSLPHNVSSLTDVCARVIKRRQSLQGETMINCSGGVGRSGTFVAIVSTWEDIMSQTFQGRFDSCTLENHQQFKDYLIEASKSAIESIRDQRHPWLVEGVGQYALIFQVLHQLSRT